ncbi:hypothetical protein D3C72_749270 [compost metagenome]
MLVAKADSNWRKKPTTSVSTVPSTMKRPPSFTQWPWLASVKKTGWAIKRM